MNPYADLVSRDLEDVADAIEEMIRERSRDLKDYDNLQNRFISGRKVGRIPSSSLDVLSTDKVGDFNYDASYVYILVDNAGTAVWRRSALASW